MTRQTIEQLPGVGAGLAQAVRRKFDDATFLAAAQSGDLQKLESIPGISSRKAVELVRHVQGLPTPESVVNTPAAQRILDDILERVHNEACTTIGKNRLRLLAPCRDQAEADARRAHILAWKKRAQTSDQKAVNAALRRLHGLATAKPRNSLDILLVPEDDYASKRLHELDADRWAQVGSPRDAAHHDGIKIWVTGEMGRSAPEGFLEASVDEAMHDMVPNRSWAWLETNRGPIQACAELGGLMDTPSAAAPLLELTLPTTEGPVELTKPARRILEELRAELDERLTGRTWDATTVLKAMSGGGIPNDLERELRDLCQEGRERLRAETTVDVGAFTPTLPLELDDDALASAMAQQEASTAENRFDAAIEGAKIIEQARESLSAEVAHWLEFDADYALGKFAARYSLQDFGWGTGMHFESGRHLELENAQPIAYDIRETSVVLLTGANSGGKTTLLEHLCQIALLARLGLPVNGEQATVDWYDEVHLITASKGLNAGAFETFLRRLLPLLRPGSKRLVLGDELEAITELESAARIIAFLIRSLQDSPGRAVVVSHMAPSVCQYVPNVRVDGIEATGLDGDELVVNRTPRTNHHARSTPELIVQRMARDVPKQDLKAVEGLLAALRESGK